MKAVVDVLSGLIEEHLAKAAEAPAVRMRRGDGAAVTTGPAAATAPAQIGFRDSARVIAERLIRQALSSGVDCLDARFEGEPMSGGATAELVGRINLDLSFVFKLDDQRKLADEAKTIQSIRTSPTLPLRFRERFPRIFALKDDEPPFAYLMEYFPTEAGYRGLDDLLFLSQLSGKDLEMEATWLLNEVLNALFEGYMASVDRRFMPNLYTDYLERIEMRLQDSARLDPAFAPVPVRIGARTCRPWSEYLQEVRRQPSRLQQIAPPFVTVVHGDPNPGNIRVKREAQGIDIRFIDVKEWGRGDYMFDITKIAHYLAVTGPVEKAPGFAASVACDVEGAEVRLQYALDRPPWLETAIQVLRRRVAGLVEACGDSQSWPLRYELGMASNLLGLPLGRLKAGRRDAALIFYAEGLKSLDAFCQGIAAL